MSVFMYVTISEEDRVSIFSLDEETGGLEHRGDAAVPGRPAPLAISLDRRTLYVGRRDELEITSYRVDRTTGRAVPHRLRITGVRSLLPGD